MGRPGYSIFIVSLYFPLGWWWWWWCPWWWGGRAALVSHCFVLCSRGGEVSGTTYLTCLPPLPAGHLWGHCLSSQTMQAVKEHLQHRHLLLKLEQPPAPPFLPPSPPLLSPIACSVAHTNKKEREKIVSNISNEVVLFLSWKQSPFHWEMFHWVFKVVLTFMLLVANLDIKKWFKKPWRIAETLTHGYSSETTQWWLSNECRVYMVFQKSFSPCVLDNSSLSI